jgi:hypothetical protein
LAFGVLLAALDQTIVATALPAIASEFKALDKIAWVATSYLLTMVNFYHVLVDLLRFFFTLMY